MRPILGITTLEPAKGGSSCILWGLEQRLLLSLGNPLHILRGFSNTAELLSPSATPEDLNDGWPGILHSLSFFLFLVWNFLEQHCLVELSLGMKMFYICAVQDSSHIPHVVAVALELWLVQLRN